MGAKRIDSDAPKASAHAGDDWLHGAGLGMLVYNVVSLSACISSSFVIAFPIHFDALVS